MGTVDEAIKELQEISKQGYGHCTLRSLTLTNPEPYIQVQFKIHLEENNRLEYYNSYRDWVEVL